MSPEDRDNAIGAIGREVSRRVYDATIHLYEQAEYAGLIVGNGHHMAQQIVSQAVDLLYERYRKRNQGEAS